MDMYQKRKMRKENREENSKKQDNLQQVNILKLGELLDIANKYIETNMQLSDLKDYLPYVIEFNTENIQTAALPGASEKPGDIWIFVHNKKQTEQLVGELFLDKPSEEEIEEHSKINIELLYVDTKEKEVEKLIETLEEQGYNVTKEEIASAPKTIIINRKQMDEEKTKEISNIVLNASLEEGEDNGEFHYTIIIGKDYDN